MKLSDRAPGETTPLEGLREFDPRLVSFLVGEQPGTPVPAPPADPAAASNAQPAATARERWLPRGRHWPLLLIALPAAVSIWSGWVGLGGMCGFGIVHPLPGIMSGLQLDSAITLPVGVEAYGAYALGAWLSPATPAAARRFAKCSAIGSLVLGMLGQVAYHLLDAAGMKVAPVPVIVAVACMPVLTLGLAASLTHLLRAEAPAPDTADTGVPAPPAGLNGHAAAAARMFSQDITAGRFPGVRKIRREMSVGQPKAQQIREYLRRLTPGQLAAVRDSEASHD